MLTPRSSCVNWIITGRIVFADTLQRSMEASTAVVDWAKQVVYVKDREEPEGIMVFSLNTGEWVRTVSTPKGDGPGEFTQGRRAFAIAPDGGLYVSGFMRVVEFDASGRVLGTWTPDRPPTQRVCNMGGVPTVPTQGGIVRRTPDNGSLPLGPVRSVGRMFVPGSGGDPTAATLRYMMNTYIACSDEAAYVATTFEQGPARVDVYRLDGSADSLAVPVEDATGTECTNQETGEPCPHWSRRARLSLDEHGNLAFLSSDPRTHGAIINPETGCYALFRAADRTQRLQPIAVKGDSAVVFHTEVTVMTVGGETTMATDPGSAIAVSIKPIRRVSGEPCEGVLPDVPPSN